MERTEKRWSPKELASERNKIIDQMLGLLQSIEPDSEIDSKLPMPNLSVSISESWDPRVTIQGFSTSDLSRFTGMLKGMQEGTVTAGSEALGAFMSRLEDAMWQAPEAKSDKEYQTIEAMTEKVHALTHQAAQLGIFNSQPLNLSRGIAMH